jgi:hypothetical protein
MINNYALKNSGQSEEELLGLGILSMADWRRVK